MRTSAVAAPVALYTDALTAADAGRVFSARGVQYGLEIWLGDKLLYRYEPTAFPRNWQMMGKLWAEVLLPEETGSAPRCFTRASFPPSSGWAIPSSPRAWRPRRRSRC